VSLREPPEGMRVELTHEGAEWRPRMSVVSLLIAGLIAALGAGALSAGATWLVAPQLPWWLVGSLVGLVLGVALMATSATRQTVAIRTDAVVVTSRKGTGVERHELRYTHLEEVRLLPPRDDTSGHRLLLVGRDERVVVGVGSPVDHLTWFRDALEEARGRHQRREGAEGKEFFFHRKKPPELADMLEER